MNKPTHLDIDQLRHVFENLGQFFHLKLFFALCFTFLSWSFDGSMEIMATLCTLIIIDTLTGTGLAIRNKILLSKGLYTGDQKAIFSSRGLYRGPIKLIVYFLMLLVSRLVDKHITPQFASPIIDAFLVSTEGYSILENFAKMGFGIPLSLIEKLKFLSGAK